MTGLQKNKEDTGSLANVRKLVLKFAAMVLFAIPAAARLLPVRMMSRKP